MNELNLFGLYVPWILLLFCLALAATRLASRLLARTGLYRFVWHPALFDVALFVILFGALNFLFPHHLS